MTKFQKNGSEFQVLKVDEDLGLVFGWAAICKTEDGAEYFDKQDQHLPESEMLKASLDFMRNSRGMDAMHDEQRVGDVFFAWPMTAEIKKAMGFRGGQTGLMVGIAPEPGAMAKFHSGEYRAFSIGGWAQADPVTAGR